MANSPFDIGPMSVDPELVDKKKREEQSPLLNSFLNDVKEKELKIAGASALLRSPEIQKNVSDTVRSSDLSEAQKRDITEKIALSPSKTTESIEKGSNDPEAGLSDKFMSSLTSFIPQIAGLVGGALIGGAEAGIYGERAGKDIQGQVANLEAMDLKRQAEARRAADEGLTKKIQVANLEARLETIAEQRKQRLGLEQDREIRREERDLERAIRAKQAFSARPDVRKIKEKLGTLDDLEGIITGAPEIAVGTIPAKIARGIAGEVGVLTDQDIKRANISPSFARNLKRDTTRILTGRLPEQDVNELKKIVAAIRGQQKDILKTKVTAFSDSRSKNIANEDVKSNFLDDLLTENEVKEISAPKPQSKRERLMELRKKHGR